MARETGVKLLLFFLCVFVSLVFVVGWLLSVLFLLLVFCTFGAFFFVCLLFG